jgi:hypothetical protein
MHCLSVYRQKTHLSLRFLFVSLGPSLAIARLCSYILGYVLRTSTLPLHLGIAQKYCSLLCKSLSGDSNPKDF